MGLGQLRQHALDGLERLLEPHDARALRHERHRVEDRQRARRDRLGELAGIAHTYGWDLSSAVNDQSGNNRRDFIWHTSAVNTGAGQIAVAVSNNSTDAPPAGDLTGGPHYTITSSGWYTFESDFENVGGVLAVAMNLRDAAGNLLYTQTLSDPSDLIASAVGGNRYLWFTFLAVDRLAVDDTLLTRNVPVTYSPPSGSTFHGGVHHVTVTATDACGNLDTCNFVVVVDDTIPPSITSCASDQTVSANTSCQAPVPDFRGGLVVTDNCGVASIMQSPAPGTLVGLGTTNVTLTAADANDNETSCVTHFHVVDTTPPTITTCPPPQTASASASCQAAVPDFVAGTVASDNCSAVTITQSPAAGTLVGVGPHAVVITAADIYGNSSTCNTSFTVNDTTPPTITSCAPAQS
ncbi:MAG: HYR domain-containing protein, partial [Actinobacteria bacterium]